MLRRVKGIGIDGTITTVSVGSVPQLPIVKGSYGDKLDPAFLSYMGSQEQDEQTLGTYKTNELKMTVSALIFRTELLPRFPVTGAGNIFIPILFHRVHPDLGNDSDLLKNCRCVNWDAAVENSNKAEETELVWTIQQIQWTDRRICINNIAGVAPTTGTF